MEMDGTSAGPSRPSMNVLKCTVWSTVQQTVIFVESQTLNITQHQDIKVQRKGSALLGLYL